MERKSIISGLVALVHFLAMGPCLLAQEAKTEAGGISLGIEASTNFEEMLAGLRIQTDELAITPKIGFFVQDVDDGTAYNIGFGCGFDYFLREGRLRPYIGGDLLVYIPHVPDDTDLWVVVSPHIGAEQWLSESFSVGGNLGVQFGFGDSFYTPNTIGVVGESNFSFGINGVLRVTYYF